MTHQPPIPEAARPPFPRHPAPHNDGAVALPPRSIDDAPMISSSARLLGIGVALIGASALAALLVRRRKPARPAGRSPGRRQSADRKRIAASQPYEVAYFARKHGLSSKEARAIIAEAGSSRAKANEIARNRGG